MADIELMTTKHYDDIIKSINKSDILNRIDANNLYCLNAKTGASVQGPVMIIGIHGDEGWAELKIGKWDNINTYAIKEFPFLIAKDGFEVVTDRYKIIEIWYVLL